MSNETAAKEPAENPGVANEADLPHCVEDNGFAKIPVDPPKKSSLVLDFADVDPDEEKKIDHTLVFHTLGCSGDAAHLQCGHMVAESMAKQEASFLYHLGDVVYKPDATKSDLPADQHNLYFHQFYTQFASYKENIFAIAGNHDGKAAKHGETDAQSRIGHFLANFCAPKRGVPDDAKDPEGGKLVSSRLTMNQPYPYWRLKTPVANVVGLYANVVNGGQFDNPKKGSTRQYQWLTDTLTHLHEKRQEQKKKCEPLHAIILAVHYPPYSGATNFTQRGDPTLSVHDNTAACRPIATWLEEAFAETKCYPDLILSAHAHLYQRITFTCADGREIPCIIAGSGGHSPVEALFKPCAEGSKPGPAKPTPFPVVLPGKYQFPKGCSAQVEAYDETHFGFMEVTVDLHHQQVRGTFFAVLNDDKQPHAKDAFALDISTHKVTTVKVEGP